MASNKVQPCSAVVELVTLDDPNLWAPPDGPIVQPPKHLEVTVRKASDKAAGATPKNGAYLDSKSSGNLVSDFFRVSDAKQLHKVDNSDYCCTRVSLEAKLARAEDAPNRNENWFIVDKIFNPDVYEAMAELIAPIENYEFYAAFELFVSHVHKAPVLMRVRNKEGIIEVWSENFAVTLHGLASFRPTTFHTVVIPLILRPIDATVAYCILQQQIGKCRGSVYKSSLARAKHRWILPLSEQFDEDQDGRLRKPAKRRLRVDLGYLFRQRRKFGSEEQESQNSVEEEDKLYYTINHRHHHHRRKLSQGAGLNGDRLSKTSVAKRVASFGRFHASGAAQGKHASGANHHISILHLKKHKFSLERLMKANKKKSPLDRLYWLHIMKEGRQQPPHSYAKLVRTKSGPPTSDVLKQMDEFLSHYFAIARREYDHECESNLHDQFDDRALQRMISDEIRESLERIEQYHPTSADSCQTRQQVVGNAMDSLRQAMNLQITNPQQDVQPLHLAAKQSVCIAGFGGVPVTSPDEERAREITGLESNRFLAYWNKIIGQSRDLKTNHKTDPVTNGQAGLQFRKSQTDAESYQTTTLSQAKSQVEKKMALKDVLLDKGDKENENCLFVKLVIDSGHDSFYFDIGGDSDGEEEEEDLETTDETKLPDPNAGRRRASSIAVESMNRWAFNYFDAVTASKLAEEFNLLRDPSEASSSNGVFGNLAKLPLWAMPTIEEATSVGSLDQIRWLDGIPEPSQLSMIPDAQLERRARSLISDVLGALPAEESMMKIGSTSSFDATLHQAHSNQNMDARFFCSSTFIPDLF